MTLSLTHFETADRTLQPRRVRALAEKRQRQIENRRQAELAAANHTATQIRLLTADLQAEVATLDACITADLEVAAIKDPAHYAFPVSIKAMMVRRDNLKVTIGALQARAQA